MPLWKSGRVALVSCSATKAAERCQAAQLYRGDLFALSVEWIQLRRAAFPDWAILSAEHGLLLPAQEVAPYDTRMAQVDRRAWGLRVAQQIRERFGTERIFTVLAGVDYSSPLMGHLPHLEAPFAHWQEQHRRAHPGGRWGLGKIKQRLKAENERMRAALLPCAECEGVDA
jgi:hypothetical protein